MIQKPEIQYVGQFYVQGSEARKIEPKKTAKQPKTRLPLARIQKVEVFYLDPVALFAVITAVVMLAVMAAGLLQLRTDWAEYDTASSYVSRLKKENAELTQEYRESYDADAIRAQAVGLGMIAAEEAQTMTITVTVPEPEPETTWLQQRIDKLIWFWEGLWE